jgi:histone H3/H4
MEIENKLLCFQCFCYHRQTKPNNINPPDRKTRIRKSQLRTRAHIQNKMSEPAQTPDSENDVFHPAGEPVTPAAADPAADTAEPAVVEPETPAVKSSKKTKPAAAKPAKNTKAADALSKTSKKGAAAKSASAEEKEPKKHVDRAPQRAPLERLVRQVGIATAEKMHIDVGSAKYEKEAMTELLEYAQKKIIAAFKDASILCKHAHRSTVNKDDWELGLAFREVS